MADFPSYAKLRPQEFGEEPDSGVSRTPMEDGMQKQLKTKSRVLVARTVVYGFSSKADYQSFKTWYFTTINHGADWFNWLDPVDNTVKLARIVNKIGKGTPINAHLVDWEIPMTIETWQT